jgi:hypothetical protein
MRFEGGKIRCRRSRRERGVVLIEFVLWFTLIAMLGIGAISFSVGVQRGMLISYAATAAASYGVSIVPDGVSNPGTVTPDVTADASGISQAALTAGAAASGLSASARYWNTCTAGSGVDQGGVTSCNGDQTITYVAVTTTATVPNFITLGGLLPSTLKLRCTSVMPLY